MAGPITWKNIGSTASAANAIDLFGGSREALNDSVGSLQDVLKGYQKTQKQNFTTGQENTAADYLDRVAQAQSLGDVQALRGDSQLQALRDRLTGDFRGQVRGALDKRETGLIEQIGNRQEFRDGQHNRDLREELQALRARARSGDESAVAEMAQLGYRDDGQMLGTVADAAESGVRLGIAKDGNARSWNTDRRSEATHDWNQYVRGREQNDHQVADTLEGIAREAALSLETAPDNATATDILRGAQEAALQAGGSTADANALVAGLDKTLQARTGTSQVDTELANQELAQLDAEYSADENEFIHQGPIADPATMATDVLGEFAEDGKLFGNDNPDWREDVVQQSGTMLRDGIEVDGDTYPVTPAILRSALHGVSDHWTDWDRTVKEAVKDYIEQSPGLKKKAKDAREYREKAQRLQRRQAQRTMSPYFQRRIPQ